MSNSKQETLVVKGLIAGYIEPIIGPLSFSLKLGEIVGIWGSNGCGKSTLLRTLINKTHIFEGSLKLKPKTTIAWQMQQPIRLKEMPLNGYDYLRYAKADLEPPDCMIPWLDQRIDKLSGGQFQLLTVWAVLGSLAEIVLLDEPTNNLDPKGEKILIEILKTKQYMLQKSILLVSHEKKILKQICNRIINIDK